jgi:uncharacterized membrane protein (DUF4010 family)
VDTLGDRALLDVFLQFGVAGLLGFLIGLEREMAGNANPNAGLRDFVLFALLGSISAFSSQQFDTYWILIAGFFGFLTLLISGFWADYGKDSNHDPGITTEAAAIMAFFLGALVMEGLLVIAVALAIVTLSILSQKPRLMAFRKRVRHFELEAALKLLIITFIILPILPNQSLDGYFSFSFGKIQSVNRETQQISVELEYPQEFSAGQSISVYEDSGRSLGTIQIEKASPTRIDAVYANEDLGQLQPGTGLRAEVGLRVLTVMLSAIQPYKVWLIVILVSFISFIGYVLVKIFGSSAGIGLTGLVGGLASSTVTTLSFARRSKESPELNRDFAIAIILASTIMFPRLLLQIAVVNLQMMLRMAVPVLIMTITGMAVAAFYYFRPREPTYKNETLALSNPFSLKSSIAFALVFASILMLTRLAITYLGDTWLPLVALISGLTDADAIAFSVSDAEQAGLISLDWAAFNVVIGAIANTLMKLFLVFTLGDRQLFKNLLGAVLIIVASGLISSFLFFDLSAVIG